MHCRIPRFSRKRKKVLAVKVETMATPREEARDDLHLVRRMSGTFSPSDLSPPRAAMRSFTTEDLPSDPKPLMSPPASSSKAAVAGAHATATAPATDKAVRRSSSSSASESSSLVGMIATDMLQTSREVLMKGIHGMNINTESVSGFVDKVKKSFAADDSERVLRTEWLVVETEEQQLEALREIIAKLEKAFQFSNGLRTLVKLAKSTLKECDDLVERCTSHVDDTKLMFSQCANEVTTLVDYLAKLKEAVNPPMAPRDKNDEKRVANRATWAISRMAQCANGIFSEMKDSMDELDYIISECTKLMVQAVTLLHMRGRSADFSGTGVAAGAASMVAGAVVGVAGLVAAPATGGLSVPISLAGKGLFFSGLAALTPSSIMLNRQSKQLSGLTALIMNLKSLLEIMNQKREELVIAYAACENLQLNIQQASDFIQDAIELESPIYESSWSFIKDIGVNISMLTRSVETFEASPSIWHFCKSEDAMYQYLLADDDDEE